jgi:hypothetical protein
MNETSKLETEFDDLLLMISPSSHYEVDPNKIYDKSQPFFGHPFFARPPTSRILILFTVFYGRAENNPKRHYTILCIHMIVWMTHFSGFHNFRFYYPFRCTLKNIVLLYTLFLVINSHALDFQNVTQYEIICYIFLSTHAEAEREREFLKRTLFYFIL